MAVKKKNNNQSAKIVVCIMMVIVVSLVLNVVYLGVTGKHLVSGNDIRNYADERGGRQKVETLYAKRGTIYSSDNEVIASDVKKYKLIAILSKRLTADKKPAYVENKEETAKKLAPIIGMDEDKLLERLSKDTYQVEFGSYGNNLSSLVKDKIDALNLPGLEFEELTTRNYRYGDFASYEIGYAQALTEQINGKSTKSIIGQMGIEKIYNEELSGTNGQKIYLADNNNYILPNGVISETAPVSGNDIYLTIDTDIQTELDLQMKKFTTAQKSDKATCVVMEAKTGRILAVSNYPSFDPNKRDIENYVDLFLNEPVEVGSVFKAFVYANALTDERLNLKATYPSGHYYYKVNGKTVADIKDHNYGKGWGSISYEKGFYYSSNTAICNMISKISNQETLKQDYDDLGFFQESDIDGLTSTAGVGGYKRSGNRDLEFLTTGFGQGSTMTALQLIRGYSAFANDGKTVEPYLIDKIVNSETKKTIYEAKSQYSKQIYSSKAVKQMLDLLSGVINIKGSTGYTFHMDDIRLIGKTGTGQVAKDGKYRTDNYYTHSFVGLAPYDDPEIVIAYWYQGKVSGNANSSALIKAVTRAALNKLNEQSVKEVETSTFVLDSYTNQSTDFAKKTLSQHQLIPLTIGDGDTVLEQYPKAKTEVSSKSRVFLQTNDTNITMPSMDGWSRKEAEAFASMANIDIEFDGIGMIYKQSVDKGTKLKDGQKVKVYAK
ncbi:penicillin-binding protein [Candidatus Stoquefichus sp. SB1]|jgi:penicillin-binding protein 2B|uniref:penicillin-binding protein n=1 Tax=Candidatus Stoquefichus sp. SB1 TaxID=1658109 RepID=UPI00067EF5C4|nr:penicillin-binding protein [Candidatus Stoquefichus sp. SB1]